MYFMSIMDIVEVWNMQSNTQQQTTFQLKNAGFFKVADNCWRYGVGLPCRHFLFTTTVTGKLHYTAGYAPFII
jgi:hypothetical protein